MSTSAPAGTLRDCQRRYAIIKSLATAVSEIKRRAPRDQQDSADDAIQCIYAALAICDAALLTGFESDGRITNRAGASHPARYHPERYLKGEREFLRHLDAFLLLAFGRERTPPMARRLDTARGALAGRMAALGLDAQNPAGDARETGDE